MKKVFYLLLVMFCMLGTTNSSFAERVPERFLTKSSAEVKSVAATCTPGAGFDMLEVNNVRSRVNTSGDMWQNYATGMAQYYIPGNSMKTSLFAGALWIGGMDVNNQLKLAAQRFRQVGVDYWPGPLTIDGTASTTKETCAQWDRMYRVSKAEVQEFIGYFNSSNQGEEYPGYDIPESIKNWPAHGNEAEGHAYNMAPFFDADGDGIYNPEVGGDYPYYDFDNVLCPLNYVDVPGWKPEETAGTIMGTEKGGLLVDQVLKGDETIWWVFNDKGNAHGETKGQPIGLEIRAQAFAFATNDEVNNMTFFSYEIINRSTFTLTETYFAPWTDADVGYSFDDYTGCDVERGMGYCYNGTNTDGTGQAHAYGENPPAVGIDFFQGPYLDPDGYDNPAYKSIPYKGPSFALTENPCEIVTKNGEKQMMTYGLTYPHDSAEIETLVRAEAINGVNFGNGIVDDERFGMRRFVYHENNNDPVIGDPQTAPEYYNFLRGIWKNNARMTYGGNGTGGSIAADFMFPGLTDVCDWGTKGTPPDEKNWTETTVGNSEGDRRFMQSAGPFTLKPGAVNYITFGVPWARANSGNAEASVAKLQEADDKCQALFDNCFKVLDGPDAPDLSFIELDRKLIVHLTNSRLSNNYKEAYAEIDQTISDTVGDRYYRFEGYQVYQLLNAEIGVEDILDESKARLVFQCDIANGVSTLVNWEDDATTGFIKPVQRVVGGDAGIRHTFEITTDRFATGSSQSLVNNRNYHYMAVAYAYNNYQTFDIENTLAGGQKLPYLSGRKNSRGEALQVTSAMPHKTVNGTIMNSSYGETPEITRIEGKGNGGMSLDLSEETKREILSKPAPTTKEILFGHKDYQIAYQPKYARNAGPVNIKVVDPLNVEGKDYILKFYDCHDTISPQNLVTREVYDYTFASYIDKGEWVLIDKETEEKYFPDASVFISYYDDETLLYPETEASNYEQIYPELGISITVKQTPQPGDYWGRHKGNGLIGWTATFADTTKKWLSGISDQDVAGSPLNWIRSGTYYEASVEESVNNDYHMRWLRTMSDAQRIEAKRNAWDPIQNYETIFGGTWAPYTLTASSFRNFNNYDTEPGSVEQSVYGPAMMAAFKPKNFMTSMGSVDIVFTSDKSLWTRSVVLEMGFTRDLTEGRQEMYLPRKAQSVDKEGNPAPVGAVASDDPNNPAYISSTGMGWFPGYAINVDTGERLNIIFGENSYYSSQNGRDMLFNPTNTISDYTANPSTGLGNFYMGGMHYVYIMGHKVIYIDQYEDDGLGREMPAYDAGRRYMELFNKPNTLDDEYRFRRQYVMGSAMYVGMPIPAAGYEDIWEEWRKGTNPEYTQNMDFTLKIRVSKPYARYSSEILENPYWEELSYNGTGYSIPLDPDYEAGIVNDHWPMYEFSTKGMETIYNDPKKEKSDVDLISIVPNPYYGYSHYERDVAANMVKITNLPKECVVTIYNAGGTMVRQFSKSEDLTTIEWDLKNFAGVPISGGVYIVHVKSPAGEKVIKWFGVMRTVDLFTF